MVIGLSLLLPSAHVHLITTRQVVWHIEASLVSKSLPCLLIELRSHELDLGTDFLSSFAGILDFKSWSHGLEIACEAKVLSEEHVVDSETEEGQPSAVAPVGINRFHVRVSVELWSVCVHLFLGVNVPEETGIAPPIS